MPEQDTKISKITKIKAVRKAHEGKPTCLLALGMHRSGTSALTRVLGIAGAKLPQNLVGPNTSNEAGHWEPADLVKYHDSLLTELSSSWDDWQPLDISRLPVKRRKEIKQEIHEIIVADYGATALFVIKDPRICRFAPFFMELLREGGINVFPVLTFRNPLEVCESLEARNGMKRVDAVLLWLRHVLDAEKATRNQNRAILTYYHFLENWQASISKISEQLDVEGWHTIKEIAPQVEEFLSSSHRHHFYNTEDVLLDPMLCDWVGGAYEALLILTRNPGSRQAIARLDKIDSEFSNASPIMSRLYAEVRKERDGEFVGLDTKLVKYKNEVGSLRAKIKKAVAKSKKLDTKLYEKELETTKLNKKLASAKEKASKFEKRFEQAQGRVSELEEQTHICDKEILGVKDELLLSEERLYAIESSRSWRVTLLVKKISQHSVINALLGAFKLFHNKIVVLRTRRLVSKSNMFDKDYYRNNNADLANKNHRELLDHYIDYGGNEGRSPSKAFDSNWYYQQYPDVFSSRQNPLLHYLRFGKVEGRSPLPAEGLKPSNNQPIHILGTPLKGTLDLISKTPVSVPELTESITILVPIYNGVMHLEELLPSLVKNTDPKHKILLVNDSSTDAGVKPLLDIYERNNKQIQVLNNDNNIGFVKTVNKAAKGDTNNFVILNSDTIVPPDWLERLMFPIIKDPTIASTTPFSNAATIFSYPEFPQDSSIVAGLSVKEIDHSFKQLQIQTNIELDAPTGVGFCMGINRQVWDKIGGFDEAAFGKGYGEENDWCQRAIASGYRNNLVPNLYVYHKHGGSFSAEEKQALIRKHLSLINSRWPEYKSSVEKFINIDKWRVLRESITLHLCCVNNPLFVLDHALGGGANAYRARLVQETLDSGRPIILLTYDAGNMCFRLQVEFDHAKALFNFADINWIGKLLGRIDRADIVISNIVGWPEPLEIVHTISRFSENVKLKIKILFHDYYAICPSYTLLNDNDNYCYVPENIEECGRCLRKNKNSELNSVSMIEWRKTWGDLLSKAHKIVCFSQASLDIAARAWPLDSEKTSVKPHQPLKDFQPLDPAPQTDRLVIGVVGNLNLSKGAKIVIDLAQELSKSEPAAKIVLLGKINPQYACELPNFIVHGSYRHSELPELIYQYGINICVLPSIWPETFSYVTQELMQLNIPLICFDLGAPAERVKDYSLGFIAEEASAASILSTIRSIRRKALYSTLDYKQAIAIE